METLDFYISPQDGWVLVADKPTYLAIKPDFNIPWAIAATTSGPPDTTGSPATGQVNFAGQPAPGDTVTVDGVTYTWVSAFNAPGPDDIKIGANTTASIAVLNTAINGRGTVAATAATGSVIFSGLPLATQTLNIGAETYTFVVLRSAPFQVTIGTDANTTGANLATALGLDSTLVTGINTSGTVALTERTAGFAGNSVTLATTAANTAVSGSTLTGGNDAAPAIPANPLASSVTDTAADILTARVTGRAGNNIGLSATGANLSVTAFSGGVAPVVGLVFGNDEFKKFEEFCLGTPVPSPPTIEVYLRVSTSSIGFPNGEVRFGIMRDQS